MKNKVLRGIFMSTLCAAVVADTVFFSSATAFAADGSNEVVIEESAETENEGEVQDAAAEDELAEAEEVVDAETEFVSVERNSEENVSEEAETSEKKGLEEVADVAAVEDSEDALAADLLEESKVATKSEAAVTLDAEAEESVTWNFDASTGTLTISGNGPMQDYSNKKDAPWYSIRSKIRKIVVEEGITRIGSRSFGDVNSGTAMLRDYAKIQLPSTLESIGSYAFDYTFVNGDIVIPENVTTIEPYGLANARIMAGFLVINAKITKLEDNACKGIQASKVYFPDTLEEIGNNAFENALSLRNFEFPNSLKKIGSKAFSIRVLNKVKFTGDLPEVAEDAFKGATDTIVVIYDAGNRTWKDVTPEKLGMGSLHPDFQPEGEPWVEPEPEPDPEPEPQPDPEPVDPNPSNPDTPDEPEIQTGFATKWGATYYVGEDGANLTGFQTIDGDEYYFNARGVMQKQTWVTADDAYYYAKADGKLVKSQMMTLWGQTYYFDENGVRQAGFISFDGDNYYAKANGHLVKSDWITDGGNTYYAKADGKLAKNETIKKWGKKYTFDENGVLVK